MNNAEHIRFSQAEQVYSERNLLTAQANLIKSIDSKQRYSKLRKKEFLLKIELKTKLEESILLLQELDKLLPKTQPGRLPDKEARSLQQELRTIREKLEELQ